MCELGGWVRSSLGFYTSGMYAWEDISVGARMFRLGDNL